MLSLAIAFFQYFYKTKSNLKVTILLFFLKSVSLFLLFLLFINPKIKIIKTENIKPILSVLVDNSISTKYFKSDKKTAALLEEIKKNDATAEVA